MDLSLESSWLNRDTYLQTNSYVTLEDKAKRKCIFQLPSYLRSYPNFDHVCTVQPNGTKLFKPFGGVISLDAILGRKLPRLGFVQVVNLIGLHRADNLLFMTPQNHSVVGYEMGEKYYIVLHHEQPILRQMIVN
ncbi:hypothetical protein HRJ45_00265 [Vibrio coralliilyticus]|uniref:hypothetical protein n=1 Tax=Vibrio coralliilyticus TaxID=190893 RepID=UPI0015618942|nr:hypothetical protein [Vibrio coralliilyticus]NRF23767.1 hypothetical protein [Vibrio coralliilyticus]NRF77522.1 hypothetical protein [Vibrio coralliilyticus]